MFIINGATAYRKAFAVCHGKTKEAQPRKVLQQLQRTGDLLFELADTYVARSYPVELRRIVAGNPRFSEHRPTWLIHVEERIKLVSPKNKNEKIEGVLGPNFLLNDLAQVRKGIKKVILTKRKEKSPFSQSEELSHDLLTEYQAFQLLFIGKWSQPKSIEFVFIKLKGGSSELYANVLFQSPEDQENKTLHICHNFRQRRVPQPPNAETLSKISFFDPEKDHEQYGMLLDLDPKLLS